MIPVTTTIFLNNEFYSIDIELDESMALERLTSMCVTWTKGKTETVLSTDKSRLPQTVLNSFWNNIDLIEVANASKASKDEIEEEALTLAEDEIKKRLAIDGLPPPRDLRIHARMLVMQDESFQSRARQRLLARAEVVSEILGGA